MEGKGLPQKEKKEWNLKKPNYSVFECPICHQKTIPGITSRVVLDHNHDTGKARGWICDRCNTGIGRFRDDIKILEKAIEYLKTK